MIFYQGLKCKIFSRAMCQAIPKWFSNFVALTLILFVETCSYWFLGACFMCHVEGASSERGDRVDFGCHVRLEVLCAPLTCWSSKR